MARLQFFDSGTRDVPTSAGLAVLRIWIGLTMALGHGWTKLVNFDTTVERFPDVLGIGSPAVNLALVVFAEVVAAGLIVLGLATRFAALTLVVNLGVAFLVAHGGRLTGPGNGELAFVFLAVFAALLVTGPGRYSLDARWFGARSTSTDDVRSTGGAIAAESQS